MLFDKRDNLIVVTAFDVAAQQLFAENDEAIQSAILLAVVVDLQTVVTLEPGHSFSQEVSDADGRVTRDLRVRLQELLVLLDQGTKETKELAAVKRRHSTLDAREILHEDFNHEDQWVVALFRDNFLANEFHRLFEPVSHEQALRAVNAVQQKVCGVDDLGSALSHVSLLWPGPRYELFDQIIFLDQRSTPEGKCAVYNVTLLFCLVVFV